MPLVCEISIEASCRPNDIITLVSIHSLDRLSPNLIVYAQLRPVHIAFALRWLALHVSLT
jgi:hypothetical protein